jgi:hypothetical protein
MVYFHHRDEKLLSLMADRVVIKIDEFKPQVWIIQICIASTLQPPPTFRLSPPSGAGQRLVGIFLP